MIERSDVALLAAIWRELDQYGGDESRAAWAVYERMKVDPMLLDAFLVHLGPVINDALERRGREQRHVQNIAEAVQESRMERGAIRFVLDHEP